MARAFRVIGGGPPDNTLGTRDRAGRDEGVSQMSREGGPFQTSDSFVCPPPFITAASVPNRDRRRGTALVEMLPRFGLTFLFPGVTRSRLGSRDARALQVTHLGFCLYFLPLFPLSSEAGLLFLALIFRRPGTAALGSELARRVRNGTKERNGRLKKKRARSQRGPTL